MFRSLFQVVCQFSSDFQENALEVCKKKSASRNWTTWSNHNEEKVS